MIAPPKMDTLIYFLGKEAARSSFVDFLEDRGITEEEYEAIKKFLLDELGIKTYC